MEPISLQGEQIVLTQPFPAIYVIPALLGVAVLSYFLRLFILKKMKIPSHPIILIGSSIKEKPLLIETLRNHNNLEPEVRDHINLNYLVDDRKFLFIKLPLKKKDIDRMKFFDPSLILYELDPFTDTASLFRQLDDLETLGREFRKVPILIVHKYKFLDVREIERFREKMEEVYKVKPYSHLSEIKSRILQGLR